MKRDAAWLLRRFHDGVVPDWQVEKVLEQDFDLLINEGTKLGGEIGELRRSAPERLRSFDEATDRALQCRNERRFKEALQEFRRAAGELVELRRFVFVGSELEKASAVIDEIESILGADLVRLTTMGVLRRLRHVARELLDQGEARKAKFVILLLKSQAHRFQSREKRKPTSSLILMLGELEARGGVEAVGALRRLIREGYLYLAERLVEDLDSALAVKDRNRSATETQGEPLMPLLQEMREIHQRADATSHSLAAWLEDAHPPISLEGRRDGDSD